MRFHFSKKKVQGVRHSRALSLHKCCSIEKIRSLKANDEKERIDLFGVFGEEAQKKRDSFLKKLKKVFSTFSRKKRRPPANTARIFGAVCGAFVLTLCVGISTVALLFGRYAGSYTEVVIPSFVSLSSDEATSTQSDLFEYSLSYSFDPERKANEIISQAPSPNVIRKLYSKDQKIRIILTVNKPKEDFILPQTVGMRTRDAQLILKNAGIDVILLQEYSDTASQGTVISCSHVAGTALKDGERVILTSSKGPKTLYVQTPDLVGLCESEAIEHLNSLGLKIGIITYAASSLATGTVISQSHKPKEMLALGTVISLTVSAGKYFDTDNRH